MNKKETTELAYELEGAVKILKRKSFFCDDNSGLKNSEKYSLLIIDALSKKEPVTPSRIAKEFNVTLAAVTHHINSLEEQKYIVRSPSADDRRVMFLKLTKKGLVMVDEIKKSHRKKICNLVEFLGEKESKKLISLMTKLNDFIEKNN